MGMLILDVTSVFQITAFPDLVVEILVFLVRIDYFHPTPDLLNGEFADKRNAFHLRSKPKLCEAVSGWDEEQTQKHKN